MNRAMRVLRSNRMIDLFFSLKGNQKACQWTEPLWGIPYNLYLPYVTLFMTSLGMSYAQIGYITSITMASEMVCAVLSGVLTDKLGRRKCTVIFDLLSWSIPELLWMCSQNFAWFVVAALFSGMWRITENSWYLLMIEDADPEQIISLNSISQLLGLLAAFFAPLSKFAVDAFGIQSTMRAFYGLAFVSMTTKFLTLYRLSAETEHGKRRMAATKNQSVFHMLYQCKDVYARIVRQRSMLLTLGILATYMLITTLNGNYWALYLRDVLGVREGNVSLFVTLKSLVMLGCGLTLIPRLRHQSIKKPVLWSVCVFALSQMTLLAEPGLALLIVSVVLEAAAVAVLSPITRSLLYINAEEDERALVIGMVYATVALVVSVFPALVGLLAQHSLKLPFAVNLLLFSLLAALTLAICRLKQSDAP